MPPPKGSDKMHPFPSVAGDSSTARHLVRHQLSFHLDSPHQHVSLPWETDPAVFRESRIQTPGDRGLAMG